MLYSSLVSILNLTRCEDKVVSQQSNTHSQTLSACKQPPDSIRGRSELLLQSTSLDECSYEIALC